MKNMMFRIFHFLVCDLHLWKISNQTATHTLFHYGSNGSHYKDKPRWQKNSTWQIFTQHLPGSRNSVSFEETEMNKMWHLFSRSPQHKPGAADVSKMLPE